MAEKLTLNRNHANGRQTHQEPGASALTVPAWRFFAFFAYTSAYKIGQAKTPNLKVWRKCLFLLVGPAGFEPATKGL